MSLWNVTRVVQSLMMPPVEMYTIIIITVMTMSQGLLQACFHICKLSPDYSHKGRPDCDCSAFKQRNVRSTAKHHPIEATSILNDSGIYYEPAAINAPPAPSFVEQIFHTSRLVPNQKPTTNDIKHNQQRKTYDTIESLADDASRQPPLTATHKYKRGGNTHESVEDQESEMPLHLYLDLDLKPSENNSKPRLEELKNMFVKFQDAEKGLSECINLHIYIFSKYNDNINKTNTNWGRVESDNLSWSQELTEIQNKCDQSASIIRQSIYEVNQSFPQKHHSSENIRDETSIIESTTNFDTLDTTVTTDHNNDYIYPFGTKIAKHNPTETNERNLPNMHTNGRSTTILPPVVTDVFQINAGKDFSKLTSSVNMIDENITYRTLLAEDEVQIPRIITKELSNGSVISVVDGYEDIDNSDFITNNIISSTSEETTESTSNTGLMKTNIDFDQILHNDLVEIKGNLYFLFGSSHIPARFIQQPGGEINIAMDGFSLCTQILDDNQSSFMNLLCNCIQQKKCNYK